MPEVTLKAWIEAPWFKGGARLAMLIGGMCLPVAGGLVLATLVRIGSVETAVAAVAAEQTQVSENLDEQQAVGALFRGEVRAEIKDVQRGISVLQTDVATIKGILEGMQRRDVSARLQSFRPVSP